MNGKQLARRIFLRTLESLDIAESISRVVRVADGVFWCGGRQYDLQRLAEMRVIAVGKAAHAMLEGFLAMVPQGVAVTGMVSAPTAARQTREGIQYFVGGHPTQNQDSLAAGQCALKLLRGCSRETLVVVLLSGGGSALMESQLLPSLTLSEVQQLNRALVTCGASIAEINTIRKHVSAVKGGRLAQAAAPASVITLAISDVPVGKESALASGPTLPDPTTCDEVADILTKYDLRARLPASLADWIGNGKMPETPKSSEPCFERTQFQLVLGMHELFHAAHRIAESEDCLAYCDNSTDDWPVEKAADALLTQLQELRASTPHQPVALIADGELSSAVSGNGIGGRNSAFVLACVEKIVGKGIVVLSVGTDGIDGNSPAAGAVADGETFARAAQMGLDAKDYFRRSDSFHFFDALGDAIVIGPTGNNLRDLRILIAMPQA